MNDSVKTDRLVLRLPEPRDKTALATMFADPVVMADLGAAKDPAAFDALFAKHDSFRHEGLGFRVVERRSDRAVIGFCGFMRGDVHHLTAGEIEAGWIIGKPHWRQGYAFEAMTAMLSWAWSNLDVTRIFAVASAVNVKSRAMMIRLGMTRLDDGDFDHPLMPASDRLRAMSTYAIDRPA